MSQTLDITKRPQAKRPKLSNEACSAELPTITTHRLPPELELQILKTVLIPRQPCVDYHFGKCRDPRSCNSGLDHGDHPLHFPDATLTAICTSWRDDALKYFFSNNTFVFSCSPYTLTQPLSEDNYQWSWQELRDPHATRLLDFVDRPDWKDKGSRLWRCNFTYPQGRHIDRYRHLIRKIALVFQPHRDRGTNNETEASDWNWILKVDWETLPDLETLYLDFSCTGPWSGWDDVPLSVIPSVKDCAKGMKCLSLKKLVLMNVSLGPGGIDVEEEKRKFERLWKGAFGDEGELVVVMDDKGKW